MQEYNLHHQDHQDGWMHYRWLIALGHKRTYHATVYNRDANLGVRK